MARSICAVIVTYNRKELLYKNLEMCFCQRRKPDSIVIIDNHSTDGTKEYIYSKLSEEKAQIIEYIYMESNQGGSGGFSYGTEWAYNYGYDYFWLMDDDGCPYNIDTLNELDQFITKKGLEEKAILINSLVVSDELYLSFGVIQNNKTVYKRAEVNGETIVDFINPFNGTLISYELVKLIGPPRGDFFIKGDEKEFLYRAQKNNAYIATINSSLYYHPIPSDRRLIKIFGGRIIVNDVGAGWKEYYNMRNVCYIYKLYEKHHVIMRMRLLITRTLKILFFGSTKIRVLKMIFIGYYHAIKNRMGIYYLPDESICLPKKQ